MLVQSLAMNLGTSSVQEIVFGKYCVSDGVIPIWPIQVKLETARVQVFNYPSFNSLIVLSQANYDNALYFFLPVGYIDTCGTWQLAGSCTWLYACLGEVVITDTWLVV